MKRILTTAIFILTGLFTLQTFAQQPLYGEWVLARITMDGKDVPVEPAKKTPGIKFDKETSATGSGGCNGFSGAYTAGSGKISFGPIRSTKMGCAPEINKQETLFFELLNKTSRYQLSGGSLILSDESGKNALRFVSLAPPPPAEDEPPAEPKVKIFLWIVDKQRVDCRDVVFKKCLQVKETDAAEWQVLRASIAGFKYRPGGYYLIRVKRILKTSMMANASVYDYKLVRVIKRTKKMPHVD